MYRDDRKLRESRELAGQTAAKVRSQRWSEVRSPDRRELVVGGAILLAVIVAAIGIVLARGGDDGATLDELGGQVSIQQQQYETLLDARPRAERLVESGASPAIVTDAFGRIDAAEQAVADSTGGMGGYVRFLEERIASEQAALELARTDGLASPAAVQAIQGNVANARAELARLQATP